MSDKIFLGNRASDMETGDVFRVTRVNLTVDSDNYYTAGDDTGQTIEVTCPWGTQEMANSILASVQGYQYQPYTAEDALLDPAAEIGDAVTLSGVYSVISSINTVFDRACAPEISAPGSDEIDDEYPYESKERKETNRQLAQTRSMITKTAEEIRLEVENELNGLSSSFTVQLDSIKSEVNGLNGQVSTISQTVSSISSTVSGLDNQVSSIEQKVDNIRLSVSNGDSSSTLTISADGTELDSATIRFRGMVTFEDLEGNGTTSINGNNLMTGTVTADLIRGDKIELIGDNKRTAGSLFLEGASSTSGQKITMESGAIELTATWGDIYLESTTGSSSYVQISDGEIVAGRGDFRSNSDGRYDCGTLNNRWATVYATSSTIITSDRNQKNSITYDMSPYDALFDKLKPTPYKYNEGTSDRTHTGMISQDVEQALEDCGLTSQDFAGFVKGVNADGEASYSLRYEEFIALCIDQIQRLKKRVSVLEGAA